MTYGVQKIAKALGESGCYFLSLLKIAESIAGCFVDPIMEASEAIESGMMRMDCFVQDPARIMMHVTRQRFEVIKMSPDYKPMPGEREILRYERPDPAGGEPLAHFVVGDGQGRCAWDPWPESLTVAQGTLISKRIIRRVS